jgi:hypothetical protein
MAKLKAMPRIPYTRRTRAGALVEIAVGTAIVVGAVLSIVELARVAATMQLDSIFSWI